MDKSQIMLLAVALGCFAGAVLGLFMRPWLVALLVFFGFQVKGYFMEPSMPGAGLLMTLPLGMMFAAPAAFLTAMLIHDRRSFGPFVQRIRLPLLVAGGSILGVKLLMAVAS